MSDIKIIESKIRNEYPPIKIRGLLKNRKETLKEFLIKFLTKWNNEKVTIFINEEDWTDHNLENENDLAIQCLQGCRRSIGDIYIICKYYYPRCTLNQIKSLIYGELKQEIPRFRSSYCSQTKRRMYYQGSNSENSNIYDLNTKDEFGLLIKDWEAL